MLQYGPWEVGAGENLCDEAFFANPPSLDAGARAMSRPLGTQVTMLWALVRTDMISLVSSQLGPVWQICML